MHFLRSHTQNMDIWLIWILAFSSRFLTEDVNILDSYSLAQNSYGKAENLETRSQKYQPHIPFTNDMSNKYAGVFLDIDFNRHIKRQHTVIFPRTNELILFKKKIANTRYISVKVS